MKTLIRKSEIPEELYVSYYTIDFGYKSKYYYIGNDSIRINNGYIYLNDKLILSLYKLPFCVLVKTNTNTRKQDLLIMTLFYELVSFIKKRNKAINIDNSIKLSSSLLRVTKDPIIISDTKPTYVETNLY